MVRRNANASLAVEVPGPGADRPSWGRVGVITAIGFIVGVAWPRLAGVRLGPSVPEAPSAAVSAPVAAEPAPAIASVARLPAASAISQTQGRTGTIATLSATATASATPSATSTATATATPTAAPPTAKVTWEVALIRDAPTKGGKILARLPRGTTLRTGTQKDGWVPVTYGDGFASDGWVYRGAIGR